MLPLRHLGDVTPRLNFHQTREWGPLSQDPRGQSFYDLFFSQNQYHLGYSNTLPSPAAAGGTHNLAYLWNTGSLCSQKTFPRRFHLSNAGLFIITTNFLTPANLYQLSQLSPSPLGYRARAIWPKLTSSAACRGWNTIPLFSYNFTSFLFSNSFTA
jgi:hypothetical protein